MEFDRMLAYCAALEAHNERSWFHENHKWYEEAREDFLSLLEHLRFAIADAAPAVSRDILYMPAKSWMYRIARDMRYYRDMPPYKPSFRAYISPDKKSPLPLGYFLQLKPGDSLLGTGLFCDSTKEMNRIRDFILRHWDELEAILLENGLTVEGDRLKTMPRGYDAAHPAADILRCKNWTVVFPLEESCLTDYESFARHASELVRRREPSRCFLLAAATGVSDENDELLRFYR